ncbi:TetR/AcrR family transcriptional regulator [Variibacter gotjawalensis]|nr:TetR/AcrR family transcriptional regulator [Variibacter gotjawalensis]NIK46512.1 AcrR family transcriptional regulator [Variibacter gotjawalensis]
MNEKLGAADWIKAGYSALRTEGYGALKADVLAKRLNVSRGSFYWHFSDIAAFHHAVIKHWRDRATEVVITELQKQPAGRARLEWLLRGALHSDAAAEPAMRAWAAHDEAAAKAVAAVDRRRRGTIVKLLEEQGVDPARAKALAAIFYWTYLGGTLTSRKLPAREVDTVVEELLALARPRS